MRGFVLIRHSTPSRVNHKILGYVRLIPVKFYMDAPNFNHLGLGCSLVLNPRTQLVSQFALTQYLDKGLGYRSLIHLLHESSTIHQL